jgi:hypothetical protein
MLNNLSIRIKHLLPLLLPSSSHLVSHTDLQEKTRLDTSTPPCWLLPLLLLAAGEGSIKVFDDGRISGSGGGG